MTDRDVLDAMGLQTYVEINSAKGRFDYLAIGRDLQWTHIADNFGYTHWHSNAFKDAVSKLGVRLEVFSFSVGDIDVSFDLQYYRDGKLVRQFVWEDPQISGGWLKQQFGSALNGEDSITHGKDPLNGLWQVASALGIENDYTKVKLMLYAPTT